MVRSETATKPLQAHDTLVSTSGYHMLIPRSSAYQWSVIGVLDPPDYSIAFQSPIEDPPQPLVVIGATLYIGIAKHTREFQDEFDSAGKVTWKSECTGPIRQEGQIGSKTWELCSGGSNDVVFLHLRERSENYYFVLSYEMSKRNFETFGGMSEVERIVNTARVW